jgi:hypothetical protein
MGANLAGRVASLCCAAALLASVANGQAAAEPAPAAAPPDEITVTGQRSLELRAAVEDLARLKQQYATEAARRRAD